MGSTPPALIRFDDVLKFDIDQLGAQDRTVTGLAAQSRT